MTKPHGQDKYRARENRSQVRAILRDHWDPIGLKGTPADEYHAYADKAYVMMMYDGASANEIAHYLEWVETDYMGLSGAEGTHRRCLEAANMIIALKTEFERPLN